MDTPEASTDDLYLRLEKLVSEKLATWQRLKLKLTSSGGLRPLDPSSIEITRPARFTPTCLDCGRAKRCRCLRPSWNVAEGNNAPKRAGRMPRTDTSSPSAAQTFVWDVEAALRRLAEIHPDAAAILIDTHVRGRRYVDIEQTFALTSDERESITQRAVIAFFFDTAERHIGLERTAA